MFSIFSEAEETFGKEGNQVNAFGEVVHFW